MVGNCRVVTSDRLKENRSRARVNRYTKSDTENIYLMTAAAEDDRKDMKIWQELWDVHFSDL